MPLLSRRCMVAGAGGQIFSGEPGVVIRRAQDVYGSLLVRFGNGAVVRYLPHEVVAVNQSVCPFRLREGVVLATRIGSHAHGIARPDSDDDVRGVFVAPPDLQWSLMATPRRIEYLRHGGLDELYYEIEGFVRRILTGDPMAVETLFSNLVVEKNEVGEYLLSRRQEFLTRPMMLGFPGFLRQAARKFHTQARKGKPQKPKALMHWIRLALSALRAVETGELTLEAREHADLLIEVRDGRWSYNRVYEEVYRIMRQLRDALDDSPLPSKPAICMADECLIFARAWAARKWLAKHESLISAVERVASVAEAKREQAAALAAENPIERRLQEGAIQAEGDEAVRTGKRRRKRRKKGRRDAGEAGGQSENGQTEVDPEASDHRADQTWLIEGEQPARVVFVSSEGMLGLNGDEVGESMVESSNGWREGPGRQGGKSAQKRRGDWEDDEDWNESPKEDGEDENGDALTLLPPPGANRGRRQRRDVAAE